MTTTNQLDELEICLARCTNLLEEPSQALIEQLCLIANREPNGPFTTLRFLAYKAQSPQEREALRALEIMEKVVKFGGFKITDEIGKFRFLNEIIKIVSPKYLAYQTSPVVRQRIVELIFLWSMEFKEMPKIFEAYQMLKVQKIVTEDPVHVLENFHPPTPPEPRPKDEIFDDEKTVKTLRALLESGSRDQLETANKLIKSLAVKAESRIQFKATFDNEVETTQNCAQLLADMIAQANVHLLIDPVKKKVVHQGATEEDIQLMRELLSNCEKSRVKLFRFAHQISDKDSEKLSQLITVAELLTSTINITKRYFTILNNPSLIALPSVVSTNASARTSTSNGTSEHGEERLLDLNSSPPVSPASIFSLDNLCNHFNELELSQKEETRVGSQTSNCILSPSMSPTLSDPQSWSGDVSKDKPGATSFSTKTPIQVNLPTRSALDDLNTLSQMLIREHLDQASSKHSVPLRNVHKQNYDMNSNENVKKDETMMDDEALAKYVTQIHLSCNEIQPYNKQEANVLPQVICHQSGVMLSLHYTNNRPSRQTMVFLLTITNHNHVSVSNIQLKIAVPKNMKLKLQAKSDSTLPAMECSQQFPSQLVSQVMILGLTQRFMSRATAEGLQLRIKYKFSYQLDYHSTHGLLREHEDNFQWTIPHSML